MELSPELRDALSRLPSLSDLLWLQEAGLPVCLIKVPAHVPFSDLTLSFGELSLEKAPAGEGYVVALPFDIRFTPQSQPHYSWSLLNPTSRSGRSLLTALSQTRHVDVLFFTEGELSYQGRKHLVWGKNHRKKALKMARAPGSSETQWPQARDYVRQRLAAQHQRQLPPAGVEKLRNPLTRSVGMLPDDPARPPRFLVKVPKETKFADIAIAFEAFSVLEYTEGNLLCLPIRLQDPNQRTMVVDCLLEFTDDKDLSLLEKLASTSVVEMFAISDENPFPILGAKQLRWPKQKQEGIQQVLRWIRLKNQSPKRRRGNAHRVTASERYQRSHPCATKFELHEASKLVVSAQSLPAPLPHSLSGEATFSYEAILGGGQQFLADAGSSHQSPLGAVIEHFRFHQWGLAEEAKRQMNPTTLRQGWHLYLAGGAEKARKLLWTAEALEVVAQESLHLYSMHDALLSLPQTHRWFEFQVPFETGASQHTAAILLLDMQDRRLLQQLAQQVPSSAQTLRLLAREILHPGRRTCSINVINSDGKLVWAWGFGVKEGQNQRTPQPYWLPPPWFRCLSGHCQGLPPQLIREGASAPFTLCPQCQEAQRFFFGWVVAAWHLVIGFNRPQRDTYTSDGGDQNPTERSKRSGLLGRRPQKQISPGDTHYRITRQIDLSSAPSRVYDEPLDSRGSWVQALLSQDPSALLYEQRDIPRRTRTLRHPRYAAYIQRTGTNQVEVRPHKKRVPMRANPKAVTKVRAKGREEKE